MYRDFEDLRDHCPAGLRASIALDFHHDDLDQLASHWPATGDGEFRLGLTQAVSEFWDKAVRARGGGEIPADGFAAEVLLDSYGDPEMGYSLYLELHAYCGTEDIGDLCWATFDDEAVERDFEEFLPRTALDLLARLIPESGLRCDVEIIEVAEV